MESTCFREIYDHFTTIIQTFLECEPEVAKEPYYNARYAKHTNILVSNFIGECSRNFHHNDPKFLSSEFQNILEKFMWAFEDEFHIDRHKFHTIDIAEELEKSNWEVQIKNLLVIKFRAYVRVVGVLEKYLNELRSRPKVISEAPPKKRRKARQRDFSLNLNDKALNHLHNYMIENQLIDKATNIDNFIDAFSGNPVDNKIVWIADQYSLYIFIQSLNRKNCFRNSLHNGIWEIVSDIFEKEEHKPFFPKPLAHSRPTKNKDYREIESHVTYIHDIITDELED